MKKIIIAIISFLVLSMPAFGSDWKQVGADKDKTYYLDMDGVVKKNKTVKFWYKIKFNTPEKKVSGKLIVEQLINVEINCSERDYYKWSMLNYFTDGSSDSKNYKDEPTSIEPGSVMDAMSKILCE